MAAGITRLGLGAGLVIAAIGLWAWPGAFPGGHFGQIFAGVALGWIGVALNWKQAPRGRAWIGFWLVAIVARLLAVGVEPAWEDDYYRYLWDGRQVVESGSSYREAPMLAFGQAGMGERFEEVLDRVNYPHLRTVYGPLAEGFFAVGYLIAPGNLVVLKLGLIAAELGALGLLWRWLPWPGRLLWAWGPPALFEVAINAHVDALGLALWAAAWVAAETRRAWWAGVAVGLAAAVKPWGILLAPFVLQRTGWRTAVMAVAAWVACYAPFWLTGGGSDLGNALTMAQGFEFNSLGFALIGAVVPIGLARPLAGGVGLVLAAWVTWRWWRAGAGWRAVPVPGVFGALLLMSPVINPWYLLWILPFVALNPRGWSISALVAVPLAYAQGQLLGGALAGRVEGFRHPFWVRPLEVLIVLAGGCRKRIKTPCSNAD